MVAMNLDLMHCKTQERSTKVTSTFNEHYLLSDFAHRVL